MFCGTGVYSRDITNTFVYSFALECESSERLLFLLVLLKKILLGRSRWPQLLFIIGYLCPTLVIFCHCPLSVGFDLVVFLISFADSTLNPMSFPFCLK